MSIVVPSSRDSLCTRSRIRRPISGGAMRGMPSLESGPSDPSSVGYSRTSTSWPSSYRLTATMLSKDCDEPPKFLAKNCRVEAGLASVIPNCTGSVHCASRKNSPRP